MDITSAPSSVTQRDLTAAGIPNEVLEGAALFMAKGGGADAVDTESEYRDLFHLLNGFAQIDLPRYDRLRSFFTSIVADKAQVQLDLADSTWNSARAAGLIQQVGTKVYYADNQADVDGEPATLLHWVDVTGGSVAHMVLSEDGFFNGPDSVRKMVPYQGALYLLVGYRAAVVEGRTVTWNPVRKSGCYGAGFEDMLLFQGKLYISNGYGIGTLDPADGRFALIDESPKYHQEGGRLSTLGERAIGMETDDYSLFASDGVFYYLPPTQPELGAYWGHCPKP